MAVAHNTASGALCPSTGGGFDACEWSAVIPCDVRASAVVWTVERVALGAFCIEGHPPAHVLSAEGRAQPHTRKRCYAGVVGGRRTHRIGARQSFFQRPCATNHLGVFALLRSLEQYSEPEGARRVFAGGTARVLHIATGCAISGSYQTAPAAPARVSTACGRALCSRCC